METTTQDAKSDAIEEHVKVRTKYPGQALRVTLVRDTAFLPHRADTHYDDEVLAELVIAPGHRLIVESGGVRVEHL